MITKYYMVVYISNRGFGNSTYTVIGENPNIDFQQALNTIQNNGHINPIIINIIELTEEQHKQFDNWVENDRKTV